MTKKLSPSSERNFMMSVVGPWTGGMIQELVTRMRNLRIKSSGVRMKRRLRRAVLDVRSPKAFEFGPIGRKDAGGWASSSAAEHW